VVSTLEQAGSCPPTPRPDRRHRRDRAGVVAGVVPRRQRTDVTALGVPPSEALARIARHGPAGAGPDWEAAVRGYRIRSRSSWHGWIPTTPIPIRGSSWSPAKWTGSGEGARAVGLHVSRGRAVAVLVLAGLTT
jgi:hypothetical protein